MLDKKIYFPLLAPRKKIQWMGRPRKEEMPLRASQKCGTVSLVKHFNDALERDHKRKCDEVDKILKKFKESPLSRPEDANDMFKRIFTVVGDEVAKEGCKGVRPEIAARRAKWASFSASSSSASAPSSAAAADSSSTAASSSVTDDNEIACVGERTVEERNKEGFANAIVIDED